MNQYFDDGWICRLYEDTAQLWERHKDPSGYAIFYSPVIFNPKIMIIGYNPGGDERSFLANNHSEPPDEHEYLKKEYRLAKRMGDIFRYAGLTTELGNTVKLNLNFFRSKKAADIADKKELSDFSEQQVLKIIGRLRPGMIITEGLTTFDRLVSLRCELVSEPVLLDQRTIARLGTIDGIQVVGLLHPSGARGISNAMLDKMGEIIQFYYSKIPGSISSSG
jgi:hypothetical protein